jgi:hypothetical protein
MLATKAHGRFIALSTPAGRRGFFFEQWQNGGDSWERVTVKGSECPRISAQFLAEELQALGPMKFDQEYNCEFTDAETSVFNSDLIQKALVNDFQPINW